MAQTITASKYILMSDTHASQRQFMRVRFSLRELMLLVVVLGSLLALLFSKPHRQRRAVDRIHRLGGTVGEAIGDGEGIPVKGEEIFSSLERTVLGDRSIRVQSVKLNGTKASDGDLRTLVPLTDTRTLDLSHTQVKGPGLDALRSMPYLEDLDLEGTGINGDFLAPLQKLAHLEILNLKNTEITSASLTHLSNLKRLRVLYLDNTKVGDDGLKHLQGCSNLEILSMEGTRVSVVGLSHLNNLSRIDVLRVQGLQLTHNDLIDAQSLAEKLTCVTRSDVVPAPQLLQNIVQAWRRREIQVASFSVKTNSVHTADGTSVPRRHECAVDNQGRVRLYCTTFSGNDGESLRAYVFNGSTSQSLKHDAACRNPVAMEWSGGAADWLRMTDSLPYALVFRALSAVGDKGSLAVSGNKQVVDGTECVVLYHREGMIWVDPTRAYIPLRFSFIDRGRTFEQYDITYKQGRIGWVPESWIHSLFDKEKNTRVSEEHTVFSCLLNQTIGEEAFRITYPVNTDKFIRQSWNKGFVRVEQ